MKKLLLLFILIPFVGFSQVQIGQDIDGKYGGYQSGNSVSSSSNGDIVAIGSPYRGGAGAAGSGHVRIYENISGVWTQIGEDINGEAEYDESGRSVSLSSDGNIVAIGAPENDDNGDNSGHVRIYENVSGVWTQIGEDINGEAADDRSGRSVSLSSDGNIVAIGAPENDGNGDNSGHVRIYENVSGVWTQIGEDINGEAAGDTDFEGIIDLSLSNDGNIVAIGAPGNDGNGDFSGHVRVYENISGVWTQIGQDIDGEIYNAIGFSVSISGDGNIVAIGAPFDNGPSVLDSSIGSVRIYENISGVWTQIGQDIYGNENNDWNGFSVSLSSDGNIVAISAPTFNYSGVTTGYVRIYKNINDVWTQIGQNINEEGERSRIILNVSLSSDGNNVIIGVPTTTTSVNAGHVKVFQNISGIWTQNGQDINGDIITSESSGSSVSLSSDGSIVAIGAVGNDDNGTNSGQVRVYNNLNDNWTQIGQDINGDEFNIIGGNGSVALSGDGNILAIGIPRNDDNGTNSGQVRVYENISGVWTQIGQEIDGESVGNFSGRSIGLSNDGNIIAIGAPGNDDNGDNSGHVRVYENISGVWTQIGQDIDGEAAGDNSGSSISLSSAGNILAISGERNDDNGDNSGHVRVYKNISGVWTQIGQDIDGEAADDRSGSSISLSSAGNILAIGSERNDDSGLDSGHVRVYENISEVWTQIGQDIDGENVGDNSGSSISLSNDGSILAIGAKRNDDNGENSGQVRVFKNISGVWTQIGQDINGEASEDGSGSSISLSSNGSIVAIGAILNDGNGLDSGHVRIYSIASELALRELVEDITGNSNGINITADQLNSIIGVSGAIEGVNYSTALANGTFADENNPTALEIQAIIDQVNVNLSINDNNIFSFNIYPNPTKTKFTIQLENNTELESITIYNNLGQQVLTSKKSIINTSKLTSGLYVVEIQTNKGKGTKKLIIE